MKKIRNKIKKFNLISEYEPKGDQPKAIEVLSKAPLVFSLTK